MSRENIFRQRIFSKFIFKIFFIHLLLPEDSSLFLKISFVNLWKIDVFNWNNFFYDIIPIFFFLLIYFVCSGFCIITGEIASLALFIIVANVRTNSSIHKAIKQIPESFYFHISFE